jgi:hypothetical protein
MDKEKEGLITSVPDALTEAAKINIADAKEMVSSAVLNLSFADPLDRVLRAPARSGRCARQWRWPARCR